MFNYLDNISLETILKYYEEGYTFNISNGHCETINTPKKEEKVDKFEQERTKHGY